MTDLNMMRLVLLGLVFIMLVLPLPLGVMAQQAKNETARNDVYPFDPDYHDYMTYPDIQARLLKIHNDHPDITEIIDATAMIKYGQTYEGRSIWAVRISNNPGVIDKTKEKVFILGPVHGDEWMGYETCMYTIDYMTDLYGLPPTDNDKDGSVNEDPIDNMDNDEDGLVDEDGIEAQVTWLVDTRETYIVPFPNPDGTEHDREIYNAGGGIWRKNARDNNNNGQFDSNFDGVDLNRNYPYMWAANRYLNIVDQNGVTITQDSSNPTTSQYHGPDDNYDNDGDSRGPAPDWWPQHNTKDWNGIDEDPVDGIDNDGDGKVDEDKDGGFSEPETLAIEALMNMLDSDENHFNGRSDVAISLTYHCVIGMILYPWGYTQGLAPDDALLKDVANKMALINGYDVVKGTDLYPTSGDSDDWFYASMGTLAYTIEVAPIGNGGFHPEPEYIINQTRENLGVNLYLVEIAELARAAKKLSYKTIDIGVPVINHTQPGDEKGVGEEYAVAAIVSSAQYMDPDSLFMVYRTKVDGGHWSDWKRTRLTQTGEGAEFKGSVPGQDGKTTVQYYFEAKDVRGPTVYCPTYAHAEPYIYKVTGFMGPAQISYSIAALLIVIIVIIVAVLAKRKKGLRRKI